MATAKKRTTATPTPPPAELPAEMQALLGADSVPPGRDKLDAIVQDAAQVLVRTARIEQLKKELEDEQEALRLLKEQTLPTLMDEAQIKSIGIDEDYTLERQDHVFANITVANAPKACAWLQKNGYGAIVKAEFKITVAKGDEKTQQRIRNGLTKAKIAFEERQGVHAQTLNAFVRESLASGRKLPSKLIGVHCQPVAVLVKKRASAAPKLKRGKGERS